ncbi:MAG: hypothetical protein JWL89_475 [Candidatus Saccharibacteria bacterium]|nr:hypothetical protein [Candidatus Saccharibacteria bacterium]
MAERHANEAGLQISPEFLDRLDSQGIEPALWFVGAPLVEAVMDNQSITAQDANEVETVAAFPAAKSVRRTRKTLS